MRAAFNPSNLPAISQIDQAGTVLVCLSKEELGWFFPDERAALGAKNIRFADSDAMRVGGWQQLLEKVQPQIILTCWSTPPIPEAYGTAPGCKLDYVCHLAGSVRAVVPRALLERGLCVTNWNAIAAGAVAEHALLLILSALRRAPRWRATLLAPYNEQTNHRIAMRTKSLVQQSVGIHGFGRVARELVKLLSPFTTRICAYSEGVPEDFILQHGATPCHSIEELFSTSTVLVECEALTPRTAGSVNVPSRRLVRSQRLSSCPSTHSMIR